MKSKNGRIARLFIDASLDKDTAELASDRAHYLRSVLRRKSGDEIVIFNGRGTERRGRIEFVSRDRATIILGDALSPIEEPQLRIVLLQALVKSEAMDLIVQKGAELGVREILPVTTEFSVVRLDDERALRRTNHWRKIAASACEQSGRHRPPRIERPRPLDDALDQLETGLSRIALHAEAERTLGSHELGISEGAGLALLIGPEGGLSTSDRSRAERAKFELAALGPRTLRTETAAIAACAIAQSRWGDMAR